MDPITQLSCFGVILGIFHVSEFLLTVKYNPDKVDASCEYHERFEYFSYFGPDQYINLANVQT